MGNLLPGRIPCFALLFSALLFDLSTADPPLCYFLDGTVADGQVPCNAAATNGTDNASACCQGVGDGYCTQNGLCLYGGILARSSCTDKSWKSLKCPRVCTNGKLSAVIHDEAILTLWRATANVDTSLNLVPCHAANTWQCGWGDCSDNFTLTASDLSIVLRDSQAPDAPDAIQFANPNNPFAAANTTSTSTIVTGGSSTSTSPAGQTTVVTVSSGAPVASGSHSNSNKSNTLPIALGISIPLGVILLACLGGLFYYRRRALSSQRTLKKTPHSSDWSSTLTPDTRQDHGTWSTAPSAVQPGTRQPTAPAREMPDRGPMPELKSPGMDSHELATSGKFPEKGADGWPTRYD